MTGARGEDEDEPGWLAVIEAGSPSRPGIVLALDPTAKFVVGRSSEADHVVADPMIARRHAAFERGPSADWVVVDGGSTNGTYVNGDRVARAVLRDGDRVQMGETVFRFFVGEDASKRASDAAHEA